MPQPPLPSSVSTCVLANFECLSYPSHCTLVALSTSNPPGGGAQAGPLPNNCTAGKKCCWLKPTFNASRTSDFCAVQSDCNSVRGITAISPHIFSSVRAVCELWVFANNGLSDQSYAQCFKGSFVHAGVSTTEIAPGQHMPLLMMGGCE